MRRAAFRHLMRKGELPRSGKRSRPGPLPRKQRAKGCFNRAREAARRDASPAALEKLGTGTKTVTINFDDGKVTVKLTIKANSSTIHPKTGDNSNPGLWITVMVLSGLGLVGLVVTDRKRRCVNKH